MLPLELHELTYTAGNAAIIRGISARIEAGPRSVILGPNGAGKSVLMRLCHGLLTPTGGRVAWHGTKNGDVRRHQAMVFQRPVMLRRTAAENIGYALASRGVARNEHSDRIAQLLDQVGLRELGARPARRLSGGEQQRLALARALAREPEVLFLDEPTASLDPSSTKAVEDIVRATAAGGVKIVMATHDLGQARRLAGDVVFLVRGRLVEHAPAEAFFTSPASQEAAAFVRGDLVI